MEGLIERLHLDRHHRVYFVGGGGKTTLVRWAARRLGRAIATTSTLIERPEGTVVVGPVEAVPPGPRPLTAARAERDEKLVGYSLDELDRLAERFPLAHLLVEADGSRGRPLKAHAAHEPMVSPRAEATVAVVGLDCLGAPLGEDVVHRSELFAMRFGCALGARISAENVASAVLGPDGYLQRSHGEFVVALTKGAEEGAREVARALDRHPLGGRVAAVVAVPPLGDT